MLGERDALLILSIPLQRREDDSWFWRKDKLGQYTVKSAYAAIREGITNNHSSSNSGFWNKIWNLKIPLKIKHFIWRAINRDCLPTKEMLISRKVEVNARCPVCNTAAETAFHVLVSCPIAALCWQHLGYTFDTHTNTSLEEWAAEMLHHSRRNLINKVFMVAWAIWNNRNDIVWQQKSKECVEIVS